MNAQDFLMLRNGLLARLGFYPRWDRRSNPFRLPASARREGARAGMAIATVIKDEAPYLEEWIEFHAMLGVRAFYIYDNGSTDGGPALLAEGGWSAEVKCLDWISFDGIRSTQLLAFAHALANYGADYRWFALTDVDEFIFPADGESLPDAMEQFVHLPGLSLPWLSFGTNGHRSRPEGLVIENYTERAAFPPDPRQFSLLRHKSILDPLAVDIVGCHSVGFREHGHLMFNEAGETVRPWEARKPGFSRAEKLRLNHYYTRSEAELAAKLAKGRVSLNGARSDTTYDRRAQQYAVATERDESALRFVPALKARIAARRQRAAAAGR